ncbi:acyl-CoA synthetase [Shewanella surugensis]|uniref:Acyl-CoA synthetase n=1 Tax=Shewanella surugensis TaxID=212020 RepID=A0ABT0L5R0_9GAMM|nr:acyl-CoA synthetase [Shewanella surugensis]MCL1122904.1 acyl-CoA synthetase [Shewanella surugensis]
MITKHPVHTLADIKAIEQTPYETLGLPENTYDSIVRSSLKCPDRDAIILVSDGERPTDVTVRYSYAELVQFMNRTANMLNALGYGRDDVVTLLLPNLPEAHFFLWGGAVSCQINPINPLLGPEMIRDIMCGANSKVLVALGNIPGTDIWDKVTAISEHIPSLETIISIGGDHLFNSSVRTSVEFRHQKHYHYESIIHEYNALSLDSHRTVKGSDITTLFHTGGTTGKPKLVQQTHINQLYICMVIDIISDLEPDDTILVGLPIFHCNAAILSGLMPLSMGNTIVIAGIDGYRTPGIVANLYRIIEHFNVASFNAVPTIYAALVQMGKPVNKLDSLKFAICGAAPMPVDLFKKFQELTQIKLIEGYGLTETTVATSLNPIAGTSKIGSIGLRFPYSDMRCVKLDNEGKLLRFCDIDEIGILLVRGPHVTPGYTQAGKNKSLFVTDTDDIRWLNTGDLAREDEDGFFWLTGRLKDVIIRGGHNIDPLIIEEALQSHPAIAFSAAVGRPDCYSGEVPAAYVVLNNGAEITEADILEYTKNTVSERAAIPKVIRILPQLPVTAVGKTFKPKLVWMQIEEVYQDVLAPALSGDRVEVTVGADDEYGTLADIKVTLAQNLKEKRSDTVIESLVQNILSEFTHRYRLTITR